MPIISSKVIEKQNYRLTLAVGCNRMENIVITENGIYNIHYIKDGKNISKTGKIINIVENDKIPKNSYILFDWSENNSSHKERIHFYQVQIIKDMTPNDAYQVAIKNGFIGSVEDWLEYMRGPAGKDAYEIAVECGFEGTKKEWIESIQGIRGYSAYEIAKNNGFEGSEKEWLESLRGGVGKSVYDLAVDNGFEGTLEEWFQSLRGEEGKSAYEIAVEHGFEGSEKEWISTVRGAEGKSAYELAIEYGFEGTIEDWFAKNGDVTVIKQDIDIIKKSLIWNTSMN